MCHFVLCHTNSCVLCFMINTSAVKGIMWIRKVLREGNIACGHQCMIQQLEIITFVRVYLMKYFPYLWNDVGHLAVNVCLSAARL